MINAKMKNPIQVVNPKWITDSIAAGRKLAERPYLVVFRSGDNKRIVDMFGMKK